MARKPDPHTESAPRQEHLAWARQALAEQALPVLTIVLGLQTLRIFIPTLYNYLGEAEGVGTMSLGLIAIALFATSFLVAGVRRVLGEGAVYAVARGVGALRLAMVFLPFPAASLALGAAGVALFLWFLPLYLGMARSHGGGAVARTGQSILLALCLDAAVLGAAGVWDLHWQAGFAPAAAIVVLAALQLLASRRPAGAAPSGPGDGPFLPTLALAGLGPFLALQTMVLGSPAAWAALTGWSTPASLAALLLSYMAALAACAWLAPRLGRNRAHWALPAAVALALIMAGPGRGAGAAFALAAGQLLAAAGLVCIFALLGQRGGNGGLWRTAVAHGIGMLSFVVGVFLYFAAYWIHLPLESTAVVPGLVALFGLTAAGAAFGLRPAPGRPAAVAATRGKAQKPAGKQEPIPTLPMRLALVPAALLVVPLALALTRPAPAAGARSWPLRVMSYNIHHGFNMSGRLDLEGLARNIEAGGADVVGLQEVTRGWYLDGSPDIAGWLSNRLGMPYVYAEAVDPYFGNMILSHLPIVSSGTAALPRTSWEMRRSLVWARLAAGDDELLFITSHTHHVEGEGAIREPQMAELVRFWDGRGKAVIVGDFNASPGDPETLLLARAGLQDAFALNGSGSGYTWPADVPNQRIDYIWLSPDLKAGDLAIGDTTASDHRSVAVTVRP